MERFVKVNFDIKCEWQAFPPAYRIYVNDELFTERTFAYDKGIFIRETLQVNAAPGMYEVRLERLGPILGNFEIANPVIELGDARIVGSNAFEILA